MNILILGAAGQIGKLVTAYLLAQTSNHLVLYARDAPSRLTLTDPARETLASGSFRDSGILVSAMQGIDVVYINDMGDDSATRAVIGAMHTAGVKRVIAASVLSIYDEVPGAFGQWNKRMLSDTARMQAQIRSASALEESSLEYTLLRLTWLYNKEGNKNYVLIPKGEPFKNTQVTRQAVAQAIVDIIGANDQRFSKQSLGVGEPNTEWNKPSFY